MVNGRSNQTYEGRGNQSLFLLLFTVVFCPGHCAPLFKKLDNQIDIQFKRQIPVVKTTYSDKETLLQLDSRLTVSTLKQIKTSYSYTNEKPYHCLTRTRQCPPVQRECQAHRPRGSPGQSSPPRCTSPYQHHTLFWAWRSTMMTSRNPSANKNTNPIISTVNSTLVWIPCSQALLPLAFKTYTDWIRGR